VFARLRVARGLPIAACVASFKFIVDAFDPSVVDARESDVAYRRGRLDKRNMPLGIILEFVVLRIAAIRLRYDDDDNSIFSRTKFYWYILCVFL